MIVKPSVSFLNEDRDPDLIANVNIIVLAMTDNTFYTDLAAKLAIVTTSLTAFSDAYWAARKLGKELTAIKNEKRKALTTLVRELAADVQRECNGVLSVLLSSGFPIQKPERQPVGPIPAPSACALSLGGRSGQLEAKASPVPSASIYNWKLMAADAPTVVLQTGQSTGASFRFAELTLGKAYTAAVNAVGTAGPSDWTLSAPQMVV
jgi:hypothetical protein